MITLIVAAAWAIVLIVSLIITFLVLIKQFKHGGALHGIIGLITGGIWTFFWGWIKHKKFKLTGAMILWTLLLILLISPMVLINVIDLPILKDAEKMIITVIKDRSFDKIMESFNKKPAKKTAIKKSKKTKKVGKLSKKKPAKDMDWSKEALALWEDGKYSDPKKALEYWNKAIRTNSKSAEIYNNRGLAFYNLKRYPQATKDFSQAIRMKPEDATAYNNRGNAYYEMLKYELAEADFNKSIDLQPDYATAYLNRGLVYYQLDKNEQACTDFAKACDLKDCDGIKWAKEEGICQASY